jgi:hypothetical protein
MQIKKKQDKFDTFEEYLEYMAFEEIACDTCCTTRDLLTDGGIIRCLDCLSDEYNESYKSE